MLVQCRSEGGSLEAQAHGETVLHRSRLRACTTTTTAQKHSGHKPSVCYQPCHVTRITITGNPLTRSRRVRLFRNIEPGRCTAHFRVQQVRPIVCAGRHQAYVSTTDTPARRTKRTLRQSGATRQRFLSGRRQQRTRHRIDNQRGKDVRGRYRDRMRHAKTPTRFCQSTFIINYWIVVPVIKPIHHQST